MEGPFPTEPARHRPFAGHFNTKVSTAPSLCESHPTPCFSTLTVTDVRRAQTSWVRRYFTISAGTTDGKPEPPHHR